MTIVDTPGTNVILQRQQRLTEEFVPRADLLLFVISADRPLTGSEVWSVILDGAYSLVLIIGYHWPGRAMTCFMLFSDCFSSLFSAVEKESGFCLE